MLYRVTILNVRNVCIDMPIDAKQCVRVLVM